MVNLVIHVGEMIENLQFIRCFGTKYQQLQPYMSSQQNRFYFPFASGPSQIIAPVSPVPVTRFRAPGPVRQYFLRPQSSRPVNPLESKVIPDQQLLHHNASSNVRFPLAGSASPNFQTVIQNVPANQTLTSGSRSHTWPNLSAPCHGTDAGMVRSGALLNDHTRLTCQTSSCKATYDMHYDGSGHQSFSTSSMENGISLHQHPSHLKFLNSDGPYQRYPSHGNSVPQPTNANSCFQVSVETQDSQRTFPRGYGSNAIPASVPNVHLGNSNSTPHARIVDQKARSTRIPVTSVPNSSFVTGRPTPPMSLQFKTSQVAEIHTETSCLASRNGRSRGDERPLRSPLRPPSTSPSRPPFPVIPSYFGWFLDYDDVIALINRARQITKQLCEDIEISKWLEWSSEDSVWVKTYSHCTSKFCAYGKREGAAEYTNHAWCKLGCRTNLTVDAIFVTPRSVGARVCLDKFQRSWWAGEEEAIPTAPHITLAVRKGIATVTCGRDLASMMQNLSSTQENKKDLFLWTDSSGEGCLISVEGITFPTTFRAFPLEML